MKTTRDEILNVSLRLFSERGFDAVSTSMIAGELGITKGALYRHFANKQEIFDSIIKKMFELDEERANENRVAPTVPKKDDEAYGKTEFEDFCSYAVNQFNFWTENEFAKNFRKMITIEQFRNEKMTKLFQDVIGYGPIKYSADILAEMMETGKLNDEAAKMGPMNLAIMLFAPLQLMIQLSDGGADKNELKRQLKEVIKDFETRWKRG